MEQLLPRRHSLRAWRGAEDPTQRAGSCLTSETIREFGTLCTWDTKALA